MSQDIKDALSRLEKDQYALTLAVHGLNEQARLTIQRLDAIITLLTPKDSDDTALSDLLGHLVMIGREQLTLAQRTLQILAALEQRLAPSDDNGAGENIPANGRRPL